MTQGTLQLGWGGGSCCSSWLRPGTPKRSPRCPPIHLRLDFGSQGCTVDGGILSHTPQGKPRTWT